MTPTSQPRTQPAEANPAALSGCASADVHRWAEEPEPHDSRQPPSGPSLPPGTALPVAQRAQPRQVMRLCQERQTRVPFHPQPAEERRGWRCPGTCVHSRGHKSQGLLKRTHCNSRGGADNCSKTHSFSVSISSPHTSCFRNLQLDTRCRSAHTAGPALAGLPHSQFCRARDCRHRVTALQCLKRHKSAPPIPTSVPQQPDRGDYSSFGQVCNRVPPWQIKAMPVPARLLTLPSLVIVL